MANTLLALLLGTGVIAMASTPAKAVAIYDTITVYNASSMVIGSVQATQAELTADPTATYYVPGVLVNVAAAFGAGNQYGVVEYMGVPIDIFGISFGGPDGLDLAFAPGLVAETYTLQNVVDYSGSPIDMTQYIDPTLQAEGDVAFFSVSGNLNITLPPTPVPEPASLALLGGGLMGLIAMRRRMMS